MPSTTHPPAPIAVSVALQMCRCPVYSTSLRWGPKHLWAAGIGTHESSACCAHALACVWRRADPRRAMSDVLRAILSSCFFFFPDCNPRNPSVSICDASRQLSMWTGRCTYEATRIARRGLTDNGSRTARARSKGSQPHAASNPVSLDSLHRACIAKVEGRTPAALATI